MGYRSQVRALIYGPEDKICALVAKHQLEGGKVFTSEMFGDNIKRFKFERQLYEENGQNDGRGYQWNGYPYEAIELIGEGWKWYDDYPDVKAWHAFMDEAADFDCNWEFVRIGEETTDIVVEQHNSDEGATFLGVSAAIFSELDEKAFVVET
jgi:hypothetical protein